MHIRARGNYLTAEFVFYNSMFARERSGKLNCPIRVTRLAELAGGLTHNTHTHMQEYIEHLAGRGPFRGLSYFNKERTKERSCPHPVAVFPASRT